jgi:hypothetical protein
VSPGDAGARREDGSRRLLSLRWRCLFTKSFV